MNDQRVSRREREKLRHQNEIVESAVDVFWQKGFNGAGVQEIANAAEFGVGTLYRLFPGGKKEIYQALQIKVVETFEGDLQKSLKKKLDETQVVRAYIRAAAKAYSLHPKEMIIYLRETAWIGGTMGRGLAPEPLARYEKCNRHAAEALARGVEKGVFRKMDPEWAMLSLGALIISLFMRWLEEPETMAVDEIVLFIEDLFLNGIKA